MRACLQSGFTLLEMLLVIAVIGVLFAVSAGFYRGVVRDVEVKDASRALIYDMKRAQANAIAGIDGYKWGVRIVNSAEDYYIVFETPTNFASASTSIESTTTLPSGVIFVDPSESGAKEILFSKATGAPASVASATLGTSISSYTQSITITQNGNIY